MRLSKFAPSLRHAIIPLLLLIILGSLAGCDGSASNSAPRVGGAKVDPDVEAQNKAAIETYSKQKGGQGR
jgi:hypothetical protein